MEKYIRFSERIGKKEVIREFQSNGLKITSKNRIWNILEEGVFIVDDKWDDELTHYKQKLYKHIWDKFFKDPIYEIPPYESRAIVELRKKYFKLYNYDVFDFIEFVMLFLKEKQFTEELNTLFEEELIPYRFVNFYLIPITNDVEIKELEFTVLKTNEFGLTNVSTHFEIALQHYSNKENPDYRNSIKEIISAVESICKLITGDKSATLGKALSKLKKNESIDKVLITGMEKLYGYTNSGSGIRHSILDKDIIQEEDARYFLVSCSAFINYLTVKAEKQGLLKTID